jgi:hypothetical protein
VLEKSDADGCSSMTAYAGYTAAPLAQGGAHGVGSALRSGLAIKTAGDDWDGDRASSHFNEMTAFVTVADLGWV